MQKILFIDTETTGLPPSPFPPFHHVDKWPRLVQLAFILSASPKDTRKVFCETIRPDGFEIPANMIHGITHDAALRSGVGIKTALWALHYAAQDADALCFHNADFDTGILTAEFYRAGFQDWAGFRPVYCTQKQAARVMQLPPEPGRFSYDGFKVPSLKALHSFLGLGDFSGAHDALADVKACRRCFFALREQYPDSVSQPYQK